MGTAVAEKKRTGLSPTKRALILLAIFAVTLITVFAVRSLLRRESSFSDGVSGDIRQEMEDSRIVFSPGSGRHTVADFAPPVITACREESRLIVYTAELTETVSVSSEWLAGWEWTAAYQDIEYTGEAQYTVDLGAMSESDFTVNNEEKTLTVRIPYAVLSLINIPPEQIKFRDVQKGWLAPKDIRLTAEENAQLTLRVTDKMKAKLIDANVIAQANACAKTVTEELLSAAVRSVDPEFTVVIVQ